jgi:hypothetical protein
MIQLIGYPLKCRYCDSIEHPSRNCPKKTLVCGTCHKKFHTSEECNLANKIKSSNQEKEQEQEEYGDEDIDEYENNNETQNATTMELGAEEKVENPINKQYSPEIESTTTITGIIIDLNNQNTIEKTGKIVSSTPVPETKNKTKNKRNSATHESKNDNNKTNKREHNSSNENDQPNQKKKAETKHLKSEAKAALYNANRQIQISHIGNTKHI